MLTTLRNIANFFSSLDQSKKIGLLAVALIILVIPLSLAALGQKQEVRKEAAGEVRRGIAGDLWADVVIGKRDFGEISPREVVADKVSSPGGVIVDRYSVPQPHPGRAYIWDSGNSRILGIDLQKCYSQPGRCSADIVIGQPSANDYGACNQNSSFQNYPYRSAASASTLCGIWDGSHTVLEDKSPSNMFVDPNGNLYVPDSLNHRVLKYNSPFTTDTVADEVWGQPDFSGNSCNITSNKILDQWSNPKASSLCFHNDSVGSHGNAVTLDSSSSLWVADGGNNRVLRFPNGSKTADLVIGQPNFTSKTTGSAINKMSSPSALLFNPNGKLYVADAGNQRILVFNPPFTSGMAASNTFGSDFTHCNAYTCTGRCESPEFDQTGCTPKPGSEPLGNPTALELDPQGRGIWVAENIAGQGRLRLLNFNGQTVKTTPRIAMSWMSGIGSVGIDNNGNLLQSDYYASDVYRYTQRSDGTYSYDRNLFTLASDQFPFYNQVTGRRLNHPAWVGLAIATNQIIVSDGRLLFWNNTNNLTNGQEPDGYVGTPTITETPNPGFGQVKTDNNNRIWASKYTRIRVYQGPLTTGAIPIKTITSPLTALGGGQITFNNVMGIAPSPDGNFLWVSQSNQHRIFRIRSPLTNPVVDVILGQTDLTNTYCNRNSSDPANTNAWAEPDANYKGINTLCWPGALSLDKQNNLYVSDHTIEWAGNKRLLMFSANLFPSEPTSIIFAPNASKIYSEHATFEPAFDSTNRMVVGFNPYSGNRFVKFYNNPTDSSTASNGQLNDFYNWPVAITFDSSDNLYVYDANRGQVRIYKTPFFSSTPTPTSSPTPTPIAADINKDGCVGRSDLDIWVNEYKNEATDSSSLADINSDRVINLLDYNEWFIATRTLPKEKICE